MIGKSDQTLKRVANAARGQRVTDSVLILPFVGAILFLLPIMWPRASGCRSRGHCDLDGFDLLICRLGWVDLLRLGSGACSQTIWRGTELNAVS